MGPSTYMAAAVTAGGALYTWGWILTKIFVHRYVYRNVYLFIYLTLNP